ncbi:MAG TPA: DUF72 domain-containing protein [Opitutaceae bacterium]|nr:DUF72 domain-containing protein [Opitutaceae bacterium]
MHSPVSNRPARKGAPLISVGIGSWTDKECKNLLYPKGLPDNERLTTYATFFDHVEVNSSYHRVPPLAFVENWVKQTPGDFVFDFKLPKEISGNPEGAARGGVHVPQVLRAAQPLIASGKLGTFFLVLPPGFGPENHRLEELEPLIEKLQPHLLAVELRHSDWVEGAQRERTLAFFRKHQLVWIAVDMPRIKGSTIMPPVDEVTNSKLAYLRLHGRRPDWLTLKDAEAKHSYEYPAGELEEIAGRVRALAKNADAVHVVANNHAQDFAPKTALALQRLLGIGKREPIANLDELLPGFSEG